MREAIEKVIAELDKRTLHHRQRSKDKNNENSDYQHGLSDGYFISTTMLKEVLRDEDDKQKFADSLHNNPTKYIQVPIKENNG